MAEPLRRYAVTLMAALALGPGTGCSLFFVKGVKSEDRRYFNPSCTTNAWAPTVDAVLTGTNTASAIYVAGQDHVVNKEAAVTVGLAVAAVWLSSAIYGFSNVNECRDLKLGPSSRRRTDGDHVDGAPSQSATFKRVPPNLVRQAAQPSGAPAVRPPEVPPVPAASAAPEADAAAPGPPGTPPPPPPPTNPPARQRGDEEEPTSRRRSPY